MSTEVTILPPKKSVTKDMADRYSMEVDSFEATVRATCSPGGKDARALTREEFAAFLLVAKEHGLNPITREIYAYPKRGGGIVPVVGIDGWLRLINSHPHFNGMNLVDNNDDKGNLVSVTATIHRKDRDHPTIVTEYLAECVRDTEPWKMKRRMLRHKAVIQGVRYAMGFAGIYDDDDGQYVANLSEAEPVKRAPAPFGPVNSPIGIENKPAVIMDQSAVLTAAADAQLATVMAADKATAQSGRAPPPTAETPASDPPGFNYVAHLTEAIAAFAKADTVDKIDDALAKYCLNIGSKLTPQQGLAIKKMAIVREQELTETA